MGLKRFSCYSLLSYSKQNLIKEGGELGQLILADKDENMKVYKQNFVLGQQCSDTMNTILRHQETEREIKNLIIDILLRVVAVRMKRIIFNPLTREQGVQQIYEI